MTPYTKEGKQVVEVEMTATKAVREMEKWEPLRKELMDKLSRRTGANSTSFERGQREQERALLREYQRMLNIINSFRADVYASLDRVKIMVPKVELDLGFRRAPVHPEGMTEEEKEEAKKLCLITES